MTSPEIDDEFRCRFCGCTYAQACETESGPCSWIGAGVCSACREPHIKETAVAMARAACANDGVQAACQRYAHANGTSAGIVGSAFRALEIPALVVAAEEAALIVAGELELLLESCCVPDENGEPLRDTLDESDRPYVEHLEALHTRLTAAIAKTRGAP